MSTSGHELVGAGEKNVRCSPSQKDFVDPVPQQLKEVIELIKSIDRRLEDCAVEWQAKISREQWKSFDSKSMPNKSWEQSLLARTYFTDKTLDEAFQGLLTYDKTFRDHLYNFIALLRGEKPTMIAKRTCNAQNQCSDFPPSERSEVFLNDLIVDPLNLSKLDHQCTNNARTSKRTLHNTLSDLQCSFTDVIKAKINFDAKFLGFEDTLNGATRRPSDSSLCLCQICSNVLETTMDSVRNCKNMSVKRRNRRAKTKCKRLIRSTRILTRGKGRNQPSTPFTTNDQSLIGTNKSYKIPVEQ